MSALSFLPIQCFLNCGEEGIPRDMMEDHVTTRCLKAEHLYPFSVHGCEFKVVYLLLFDLSSQ